MVSFLNGLFGLLSLISSLHPIHVSVTEIEYDLQDQTLEIMMRIFSDDLELTLRRAFDRAAFDILRPESKGTTDTLMKRYLERHLQISLDGKRQTLNYLGHEPEGDALVFFLDARKVTRWKTIEVRNDVIMETYDDQSNIIHVFVGEDVRSARLTPRKPVTRLTF